MHNAHGHCWYLHLCNTVWYSSQRVLALQRCTSDKVQTTAVQILCTGTLGLVTVHMITMSAWLYSKLVCWINF